MADTGREAIGRFFESHRKAVLRLAHKLGAVYPEDAVQEVMVRLLAMKNPDLSFTGVARQLTSLLFRDRFVERGKETRSFEDRPDEVHGDIDRLVRLEHGGRVAPKKGAD